METPLARTKTGMEAPASEPGLRELGKRERLDRIKRAARAVIAEKGYESATTRAIAARARVSLGTLFAYARNKHELLLMIINDDLDELTQVFFDERSWNRPLIRLLVDFFRPRYEYWANDPELLRYALYEMPANPEASGPQAIRFQTRRPNAIAKLRDLIARKQASGKLAKDVDPEMAASLFFSIYVSESMNWLRHPKPDLKRGMARLRQMLLLAMRGVNAAPEEM